MMCRVSYKFKLNLTEDLVEELRMFAGTRRWVWNELLELRQKHYEKTGKTLSQSKQDQHIRDLKYGEEPWLSVVPAQLPQQALRDLNAAKNIKRLGTQKLAEGHPESINVSGDETSGFSVTGKIEVLSSNEKPCGVT